MPEFRRPKLTNRGAFGLHTRLTDSARSALVGEVNTVRSSNNIIAKHKITPALQYLAVPIANLVLDPNNARLHPERNMEAIKLSLTTFGQLKPIVVRKSDNVVIAGNGTLEAARELGWTELAVTFVDMGTGEAASYSLADNRTAELAKWESEIIAKLDKLSIEAGYPSVGWSNDELAVIRAANWIKPEESEYDDGEKCITLKLTFEQTEKFTNVVSDLRKRRGCTKLSLNDCFDIICKEWINLSNTKY